MGPRPDGRGKAHRSSRADGDIVASMGPRPDGRGKRSTTKSSARTSARQWGRGQTAAERRRNGRALADGMGVNGAAARRPRKEEFCTGLSLASSASMGPRPDGRGKEIDVLWDEVRRFASMGPRPDGRGKARLARPSSLGVIASMGPRPDGRGKLPTPRCSAPARPASMGPRPDGRGKLHRALPREWTEKRQWGRGQTAAESRPS